MTSTFAPSWSTSAVVASPGVYPPQEDSLLLIDTLQHHVDVTGKTVADVCTGSGVVAIAAARSGAARVDAFDVSPDAVRCARGNADRAHAEVNLYEGSLAHAAARGPYDVIVSNPPYVPTPTNHRDEEICADAGPPQAWNAGQDGRLVLDPLCQMAPDLLTTGGTLLVVHSEIAGIGQTLTALQAAGLTARVVATQRIPFGPVMTARRAWLTRTGRLPTKHHDEKLVVIGARKS